VTLCAHTFSWVAALTSGQKVAWRSEEKAGTSPAAALRRCSPFFRI
jgi:hypothetical protein